ncbi:putative NADPH-quinone reductase [Pseudorhizobium tarimense]|uniref:NADPH-quinone reductase n=1 Tax=Pseudorhizobium tarimense TaxID=1079109 RepID=A0ABV2H3Q8_9HYPH
MPALLKAFLEQTARPGFAYDSSKPPFRNGLLTGKWAHVIITMGMPSWAYRIFYGSHNFKAMKIGILQFVGIRPVRPTLIGSVGSPVFNGGAWLKKMEQLGERAR